MIQLGKKTLFLLILSMSTCAGISALLIDWSNINSNLSFFKEFHLTFIFIGLGLFFIPPYVKKLKEPK